MKYIISDHKTGTFLSTWIIDSLNKSNFSLIKYQLLKKFNRGLLYKNKETRIYINKLMSLFISNDELNNYILKKNFYLFSNNQKIEDKSLAIIRDPREIIISGYLYHLKCDEEWCVKPNSNYYDNWLSSHFKSEDITKNKAYLKFGDNFSNKTSYQEKLKSMNSTDGIIFEMKNVAFLTISGMMQICKNKSIKKIKFEDLIFNSNNAIDEIQEFFNCIDKNFFKRNMNKYLLSNKDYFKTTKNHVTNYEQKKYRFKDYWNSRIDGEFKKTFHEALSICKY